MEFEDSKIYSALYDIPFHKVAGKILELTESGRDVTIRDNLGRTFLHHVAEAPEKFGDTRAVPVVYQLCLAGVDVNALDFQGDTALHKVAWKQGGHRIVKALIRCGADVNIKDKAGMTARDVIEERALPGCDEIIYWFNKFSPGLKESALKGDRETTERLLKSWCRTKISKQGKLFNIHIADLVKREDVPNKQEILSLLRRYADTNELAIATLAGSPKKVIECMKKGKADINSRDISYQYHYPNSPCVPQPLLAAAWEQDNYDLIDAIMSFNPDTSLMYANHRWKSQIPLFFHVLCGKPKPSKVSIVNRVIRGSDLKRTNHKGQTILFEAIKEGMPVEFVKGLLKRGVDFTWRDYKGRTARDVAEEVLGDEYIECLDRLVLNIVAERNITKLYFLITRGYDYIPKIIYGSTAKALELAHDLREKRNYKEISDVLDVLPKLQKYMWKSFKAAEHNDIETLQRLLTQIAQIGVSQNYCGQTLLHRAVLNRNIEIMKWLGKKFPNLIDRTDNLLRTPLHYAICVYGVNSEEAACLFSLGASEHCKEAMGKTPKEYSEASLTTIQHEELKRSITEFYTQVYVDNTNFDYRLRSAATSGCFDDIAHVVREAKENNVDLKDYSDLLFDCIDTSQTDAAMFLIDNGADPDIWARYEACDPGNEQCAGRKCKHPIVSLRQRADELGYESVASFIERVKTAGTRTTAGTSRGGTASSTPFNEMALFGTL